jgi:hypothetical protein
MGGILEERSKLNKWNCLTYLGAARRLRVTQWRIRYAVQSQYLPPPSVVLKQRALFSPKQVEDMRAYFDKENAYRRIAADDRTKGPSEE